eukprot:1251967-Amphidinium_carterae.1
MTSACQCHLYKVDLKQFATDGDTTRAVDRPSPRGTRLGDLLAALWICVRSEGVRAPRLQPQCGARLK